MKTLQRGPDDLLRRQSVLRMEKGRKADFNIETLFTGKILDQFDDSTGNVLAPLQHLEGILEQFQVGG